MTNSSVWDISWNLELNLLFSQAQVNLLNVQTSNNLTKYNAKLAELEEL